jgi:hypothetical protein
MKIEGKRMPISGSETVLGLNQNQNQKSSSPLFQAQIEGIGEVKIVVVDEGGRRVSYIVSMECIEEEEIIEEEVEVKVKKLKMADGETERRVKEHVRNG